MSINKKGRHCNADQAKTNHQDYATSGEAPAIFSPEIDGMIDRAGGWQALSTIMRLQPVDVILGVLAGVLTYLLIKMGINVL